MLGLLLLYFIGKYFKSLAETYDKKPWPWAILGIVIYFAGTFTGGIIIAGICLAVDYDINGIPDMAINLIALPFGLLAAWIAYRMMEKSWQGESSGEHNTLDEDLL